MKPRAIGSLPSCSKDFDELHQSQRGLVPGRRKVRSTQALIRGANPGLGVAVVITADQVRMALAGERRASSPQAVR